MPPEFLNQEGQILISLNFIISLSKFVKIARGKFNELNYITFHGLRI